MRYVNSDAEAVQTKPNVKVHYFNGGRDTSAVDYVHYPKGWYWWTIGSKTVSDGEPIGPFDSEIDAINDAQGNV